jgi:hypothetical protein
MSKNKTFFLINNESNSQDALLVRNQFHKALTEKGIIKEILLDENHLEIEEKNPGAKLKKVKIEQLNYSNQKFTVEKIWRVNLEATVPGFSTADRTTEVAVLVLQKFLDNNYKLNILLIELKSSLQPRKKKKSGTIENSSLLQIKGKLEAAASRMYMLMSLNNYANPDKGYDRATIHINFKGVVFYNENKITAEDISNNNEKLIYDIFNQPEATGILTCETILSNKDKIKLKFIANQNREESSITVPLKDLL